MLAKYHKLCFQFGMYTKLENILAEILVLVVQAIEYDLCMFKQARHLISFVCTHIKRIEAARVKTVDFHKLTKLKQWTIITQSLYLAVNLHKSYENMMEKSDIGIFFDKCEKFKDDEIEEVDLPIRLARNQAEIHTLYQKMCSLEFELNDPVLNAYFDAIKASVHAIPFAS